MRKADVTLESDSRGSPWPCPVLLTHGSAVSGFGGWLVGWFCPIVLDCIVSLKDSVHPEPQNVALLEIFRCY